MIDHISIKNFAIIENTEVDFEEGLNIITGETGSGKSIAVEAISLALGSRADTSSVRTGTDKAVVQLLGTLEDEEIVITTRKNGDVIPLEFDDVKVAYKGNPLNDINLPEIPEEYKQQYNQLEKNRKVMHIKHFSRDLSHEEWFNFIDNEVFDFIEKYPQFSDIIIEN